MLALVQAALFASLVHQGADVSVTVHANVHVATVSDKLIGAGAYVRRLNYIYMYFFYAPSLTVFSISYMLHMMNACYPIIAQGLRMSTTNSLADFTHR